MTELPPVEASHLSNFIGCIWRELKLKVGTILNPTWNDTELYLIICEKKVDFTHFIMKHEVFVFDATAEKKTVKELD